MTELENSGWGLVPSDALRELEDCGGKRKREIQKAQQELESFETPDAL